MIYDLTLPIWPGMPVYPGDHPTEFKPHLTHESDQFSVHTLTLSSHIGTHVDAPYHAVPGGRYVDDSRILEACVGPARMVRIGGRRNRDIMPDDLGDVINEIGEGDRLIIATGWSECFSAPDYHVAHPRLSPALASVIAEKRPALIGIDVPSVHTVEGQPVHHILLDAGIVIVENLAHLNQLPERFMFSAAPLRLTKLDGSPVRAYAIVE